MPQKPTFPPPPLLAPARAPAAHVQAAVVRAAQAKMPERPPAPRTATHVQAAEARLGNVVPAPMLRPASSKAAIQLSSEKSKNKGKVKAEKKDDSEKKLTYTDLTKSFSSKEQADVRIEVSGVMGIVDKGHPKHKGSFSADQTLMQIIDNLFEPVKNRPWAKMQIVVEKVKAAYKYDPYAKTVLTSEA